MSKNIVVRIGNLHFKGKRERKLESIENPSLRFVAGVSLREKMELTT
jgi:hypothetical protein